MMSADSRRRTNFCPCCVPSTHCPLDYEKIDNFNNIGLVIYNRVTGADNIYQPYKTNENTKSIIVQNTSNEAITSIDLLREIEKRDMSCLKCSKIIDLVYRLLQKVPALDKEVTIGICDQCKLKDPCFDCKENTAKFFQSYNAEKEKYREQVLEWENNMKKMAEESFQEWYGKRPQKEEPQKSKDQSLLQRESTKPNKKMNVHGILRSSRTATSTKIKSKTESSTKELLTREKLKSDSELRMDHLLRRAYTRAARDLNISDLIRSSQTQITEHILPYISPKSSISTKDSESLIFGELPATMIQATRQKIEFDNISFSTHDESKASMASFEKITSKTWSKSRKQRKLYKDDVILKNGEDIFPQYRETPQYAHEKEKYEEYVDIDDQVDYDIGIRMPTSKRKEGEKRTKLAIDTRYKHKITSDRKPNEEAIDTMSGDDLREAGVISILKARKDTKMKLLKFPKVQRSSMEPKEENELYREFSFSFPSEPTKPRKVFRHKSSSEIIKDTHEMLQARTEEIVRKIEEKRLLSAQKKEAKQFAKEEKARQAEEKLRLAEERKLIEGENKIMARIESKLRKDIDTRSRSDDEDKRSKEDETRETPEIESDSTERDQKQKSETTAQIKPEKNQDLTDKLRDKTQVIAGEQKYETKDITGKTKSDTKDKTTILTGKFKGEAKDVKAKVTILKDKSEKESATGDKKGIKFVRKDIEKVKAGEGEGKEAPEKKSKKETWKIKMQKDKQKDVNVKIGKGIDPNKPKHLLDKGLAEILKGKNIFKSRDVAQLARLRDRVQTPPPKEPKEKKKKIQKFRLRRPSVDVKPLLVKFKRGIVRPGYKFKGKTIRYLFDVHETKHKVIKDPVCPFCLSSDLELDFEFRKPVKYQQYATEFIKGKKIIDGSLANKEDEVERKPTLFHTTYEIPIADVALKSKAMKEEDTSKNPTPTSSTKVKSEQQGEASGLIRYVLSDRSFIDKGWTMLPTEKVMRKMNVYRMRPAKPEFDWFKRNKNKRKILYESGEPLAQIDDDQRCRWFYKNGRTALHYYNAEEQNAQQRFIVYSNGEPDEGGRPRPYTILAMFDYLGNGIVYDHTGKTRLKYNQTEGIVLDKNIGPVSHWKWHTLNDPPILQQVMIDTQLAHKDPHIYSLDHEESNHQPRQINEDMVAIEFDNFVKEKSKKLSQKFKPFQIRMKALRINEHFSLKILDQASVYLIYRDGTTNIKLNIGMLLDHKEIVDTDTAEVGIVSSDVERFPAKTASLEKIQTNVARAKCIEKWRLARERRLKPPEPSASVDKLTAAVARPLRPPLRAVNSKSTLPDSTSTPKNARSDTSLRKTNYDNLYCCKPLMFQ